MTNGMDTKHSFWKSLWKNKIYIFLSLVLSILFIISSFSEGAKKEKQASQAQTSQVQTKLKNAEESFQKAMKDKGSVESYLKEHPKETAILGYTVLSFFALFLFGLWLDLSLLSKKLRGQHLLEAVPSAGSPPWSIGDVFRIIILFISFSILVGWIGEWAGRLNPHVFNSNGQLILHGTLSDLVALGLVLFFSHIKYRQPFFQLQIRKENIWKDIRIGFATYLAALPVVIAALLLLVWIVSLFHYEPPPQKVVEIFIEEGVRNPFLVFYTAFLAMVMGPVLEEIFFRGFFYPAFRKKYTAVPAALVTGIFFALLHQSAFAFLPIFLLSLLLTYLYEKTQSLVASITLHVFHNTLFLGYFFLMKENFLDKFLH